MAWLPGWYYRKQITISAAQVDSSLSEFPLCVPLAQSDFSGALADGADLRFTASDGITLLDYIWTGWTENNWNGAYVKVPSINETTDTIIYLYYGNDSVSDASDAASVLADYAVFWPARNWTDGQPELANGLAIAKNHTSSNAAAQSNGVRINGTYGVKIGENQSLPSLLEGKSGFTVSCLAKDFSFENEVHLYIFRSDATGADFYNGNFIKETSQSSWVFCYYSENINISFDSGFPDTGTQSMHYAFRHKLQSSTDTAKLEVFFDNATKVSYSKADTATSYGAVTNSYPCSIGGNPFVPTVVPCTVAEFRVLKGTASDAWLKFENANLMTAGNQLTFADEESLLTVEGPYQVAMLDTFQTDIQQAETYIPGIVAGHTYGT